MFDPSPTPRVRVFSLEDFRALAALSGDHNPVHVDAVEARRSVFGAPVAHGVSLLLWALDATRDAWGTVQEIHAVFRQPVRDGDQADLHVETTAGGLRIRIESEGRRVAEVQVVSSEAASTVGDPWPVPPPEPCRDLSYVQACADAGEVPLGHDAAGARRLFPRVADAMPADHLSALLAISRLIGMRCPGRHSLLSGLRIRFAGGGRRPRALRYEAEAADQRFGALRLSVRADGIEAVADAVSSPRPVDQAPFTSIRGVGPREFQGVSALVVGGSRGLGEAAAKLLAKGGAHVRVTFHLGRADAERVVAEIRAGGGSADCRHCDVLEREPLAAALKNGFRPTHLLYFATPFIALAESTSFSPRLFRQYCAYYVEGFMACAGAALACPGLRGVLYPSSAALDEVLPRAVEYAAAKAAGETVVLHLGKRHPSLRLRAPRLPRVLTDRTASVLPVPAADAASVLLPELRALTVDGQPDV